VSGEPSVRVSARGASRLRAGHPWIFRADVASAPEGGGDVVRVTDERGRALASALWAAPPAPIALRVYARGDRFVPFDEALIAERLSRAAARRRDLYGAAAGADAVGAGGPDPAPPVWGAARARSRPSMDAWRMVHAEADQLPGLFVDRWGDAFVIQSAAAAIDRREAVVAAILARDHGARLVVARDDGSARDHEALPRRKEILRGAGPTLVRVREGEATLELDLLEDAKTGGFLDQRENHARAAELARGETIDAFSYHGGFALAMARRADRVLAFDQDPRAVERTRRNAALSGLGNIDARAADAFVELRELERAGRRFDVVVVDPPALAKRKGAVDAALRAYKELNLRALRITARDGLLVTCSCSGRVTTALFEAMLVDAARDAKRDVAVLERRGAGRDHPVLLGVPETEYLKCFVLRVM
jgi:23S rRNA (cytosine1962-C5)-methyltransferase